jgi:hypothetical protein
LSTTKRELWLLSDGDGIGGAESRMIKVAAKISEVTEFRQINILVTEELYQSYKNHKSLNHLLSNKKFKFVIYKDPLQKLWNLFFNLAQSLDINKKAVERYLLKKRSWISFLRKHVKKSDVIHCYMGDNARNGAFLFSQKVENKVIIEITNNRYIERLVHQFKILNQKGVDHKNCFIRSVSERVHKNLTSGLNEDWFKKRDIDISYYSGPFIESKKSLDNSEKERVIIFPHRFVGPKNGVLFSKVIKELLQQRKLEGWRILFRGIGSDETEIKQNLAPWIDSGQVEVGYSHNLYVDFQKSLIAVSLITTGSYPSQSLFEAMQAGCMLLISDSGNSRKEFSHPDIQFTGLDTESIKRNLLHLVNKDRSEFQKIEKSMKEYFNWFIENRNQLNDVIDLYHIKQ